MMDFENVIADHQYKMALNGDFIRTKKIILPISSEAKKVKEILDKNGQTTFEYIFEEHIGYLCYKGFCSMDSTLTKRITLHENLKTYDKSQNVNTAHMIEEIVKEDGEIIPSQLLELLSIITTSNNDFLLCETLKDFKEWNLSMLKKVFDVFLKSMFYQRYLKWRFLECNLKITEKDFNILRILGKGAFGEVHAIQKKDTGKLYAVKCLDKRYLKIRRKENIAINEQRILSKCQSPFIVNLAYAYQSEEKLYMVMTLMNGGDLRFHLNICRRFSEKKARFYAMEILSGIEHLHNQEIVYRDLKSSNVLLDELGHCRISDLGLACQLGNGKYKDSVSGTTGYMAPEVIRKEKYGIWVDWWSYGCLLYEMIRGKTPFRTNRKHNREEVKKNTLVMEVEYTEHFSPNAKSLLQGLLNRNTEERFGMSGPDIIRKHKFFVDGEFSWTDIEQKVIPPGFVPDKRVIYTRNVSQIGNVGESDRIERTELTDVDQEKYFNFDMIISQEWQKEMVSSGVYDEVNDRAVDIPTRLRQKLNDTIKSFKKSNLFKQNSALSRSNTTPAADTTAEMQDYALTLDHNDQYGSVDMRTTARPQHRRTGHFAPSLTSHLGKKNVYLNTSLACTVNVASAFPLISGVAEVLQPVREEQEMRKELHRSRSGTANSLNLHIFSAGGSATNLMDVSSDKEDETFEEDAEYSLIKKQASTSNTTDTLLVGAKKVPSTTSKIVKRISLPTNLATIPAKERYSMHVIDDKQDDDDEDEIKFLDENSLKFLNEQAKNRKETAQTTNEKETEQDRKESEQTKNRKETKRVKESNVINQTQHRKEIEQVQNRKETERVKNSRITKQDQDGKETEQADSKKIEQATDRKEMEQVKDSKITKQDKDGRETEQVKDRKQIEQDRKQIEQATDRKETEQIEDRKETKRGKDSKVTKQGQDRKETEQSNNRKGTKDPKFRKETILQGNDRKATKQTSDRKEAEQVKYRKETEQAIDRHEIEDYIDRTEPEPTKIGIATEQAKDLKVSEQANERKETEQASMSHTNHDDNT